ncbi:MAG TPA: FG-GAP-like repeat-containing protein [Bryobacteraceae bacterium]
MKELALKNYLIAAIVMALFLQSLAGQSDPKAIPISIIVVSNAAEAQRLHKQLESGADFAALAKQNSIDPTASEGGYLGELNPADLRQEFQQALKPVRPGGISAVTQFPSGFAILKILSEDPQKRLEDIHRDREQFISSSADVHWTADFSGQSTTLDVLRVAKKPDDWNQSESMVCRVENEAPAAAIRSVGEILAGPADQDTSRADFLVARAAVYSARGEFENAFEDVQAVSKLVIPNSPAKAEALEELEGLLRLQRAGTSLYDSFVLGAQPAVPVTKERMADLEKAIGVFSHALRKEPADLEVKWLLNLAYMLEGRYPAAVPAEWLIAPATPPPAMPGLHFRDVAAAAKLISRGMAGGAIAEDFDGDGLIDVAISSMDDCVPLKLFHNNGDGTFTDRAKEAGLRNQTGGLNMIQTDYNNDGCIDILVLRGGWEFPRRKSLLRNNCDGTFADVTDQAGLATRLSQTQTAVWADIDNDGKLDLFVGNEDGPPQLFLNKGDGTFTDIAQQAGVARTAMTKAIVAADYDNDGFVDFYLSNYNGENFLYHNNGDRTFTEVAAQAGVQDPWSSFGAFFFDFDNDGWPDLFVTGYCMSVDEWVRGYVGLQRKCESSKLYRNLHNGKFTDVSKEAGLDKAMMAMGHNFGDIDNDGYLDFYLGSGNPSYATAVPNLMFHNEGGKRFTDVTVPSGTGILPKGHGIAFADFSNQGKQDLLVIMGGAVRGDVHNLRLFENPGNGNDWINIHLTGVKSNRVAIGARITLTVTNQGAGTRTISRTVGSGGSFGANPFTQEIGLGKAAQIDSVEIWWPASGTKQKFTGVQKNQFIEIEELAKAPRKRTVHSFKLGK